MKFLYFFFFVGHFCPPEIRIRILNADPDPEPSTRINADPCGSGSATLVNGNAFYLFLVLHEDLLQSDNLIFVRLALGLENFSKGALSDFCNFLIPVQKQKGHADTCETDISMTHPTWRIDSCISKSRKTKQRKGIERLSLRLQWFRANPAPDSGMLCSKNSILITEGTKLNFLTKHSLQ